MTPNAYHPSPPAQVDCERTEDRWTLVFTRDLRHPPEKVWAALTEPEQLAAWAPYTADRNLSEAGGATITMIDDEKPQDMAAEVVRAQPPTLLEYTLGTDLLRWELAATDTGARLTLRHTVQDRDWIPKVAAGWHICLDVAEKLLEGHPIPPIRGAAAVDFGWSELNDQYAHKFGIPNTGLPDLKPQNEAS
ncbi:SRPBCC family protein [Nonomuraea sp. NPDC051941]|uniref:SRPBCC family protein n=1 Tax=Nonomuraea sp. NPDC051941 TaxID=3364373 RepID=UPI0037CCA614